MKINPFKTTNPFCPAARLYHETGRFQAANTGTDRQSANADRITISLFGQNSRVESLMKQRHSLLERKNELIRSTLENGGNRESIQDLLDTYEEQMKNLDQQISQEMADLNADQPDKNPSASKNNTTKTEAELRKEQIFGLVNLSSGLSQTEAMQSAKTAIEGEARVLKSEIRMDKGRGGDPEAIAKREEKLTNLQQKATGLSADIAKTAGDTAKQIDENYRSAKEAAREETKNEDNPPA